MNTDDIRKLMNEYGHRKQPFLFAVNFDGTDGLFISNPLEQSEYLFRVPLASNYYAHSDSGKKDIPIKMSKYPIPYTEYNEKFNRVISALKRGDSFLVNLTLKTPISLDLTSNDLKIKYKKNLTKKAEAINCDEAIKYIFKNSNSNYALYVPHRFVSFSPERFVKIKNGIISTNPMKGTIDAETENAEQKILSDSKETAEHYTVVDLLRNDLGIVAKNIRVNKFRYIDKIATQNGNILQVSSEIIGELPDDYLSKLGDIIFPMLPAGSICGAPKKSTVDIINKAEQESRGYYTGIFGYFNGEELDSAVLIRFIEKDGNQYYFRSGGGITINSNAADEYQETLDKIYLPFTL